MFYTIASKIPFISGGKNGFLTIFILGSLAYVILHYYLWSSPQLDIVDKMKSYMYYLIFIDLAIAYFLSRGYVSNDEQEEGGYSNEEKKEIEDSIMELKKSRQVDADTYRNRMLQMQQEQLAQAQYEQQLQQQQLQQIQKDADEANSNAGSHQSPFKTIDEVESERRQSEEDKAKKSKSSKSKASKESSDKCTTTSSSSSSEDERPKKVLKKKKEQEKTVKKSDKKSSKKRSEEEDEIEEDTNIPVWK